MRASSAGTNALFDDWGVQYREWYATPDDRTRGPDSPQSPSNYDHRVGAAFGQEPLIAKMGEPFIIGGEALMYPGDPAGSPGNTISCRCTILPVIPEEGVTEQ